MKWIRNKSNRAQSSVNVITRGYLRHVGVVDELRKKRFEPAGQTSGGGELRRRRRDSDEGQGKRVLVLPQADNAGVLRGSITGVWALFVPRVVYEVLG